MSMITALALWITVMEKQALYFLDVTLANNNNKI